jgi:hypothetical protein
MHQWEPGVGTPVVAMRRMSLTSDRRAASQTLTLPVPGGYRYYNF